MKKICIPLPGSEKEHIESYKKNWELLQIYIPLEKAKRVQLLFRK